MFTSTTLTIRITSAFPKDKVLSAPIAPVTVSLFSLVLAFSSTCFLIVAINSQAAPLGTPAIVIDFVLLFVTGPYPPLPVPFVNFVAPPTGDKTCVAFNSAGKDISEPVIVNVTLVPLAVAFKCSRIKIVLSVVVVPVSFNVLIASNGNLKTKELLPVSSSSAWELVVAIVAANAWVAGEPESVCATLLTLLNVLAPVIFISNKNSLLWPVFEIISNPLALAVPIVEPPLSFKSNVLNVSMSGKPVTELVVTRTKEPTTTLVAA